MTRLPIIVAAAIFSLLVSVPVRAQESDSRVILRTLDPNNPTGVWIENSTYHGTNGIFLSFKGTILTADSVVMHRDSGEATADGHVRIQQGDEVMVGEHVRYNFYTHNMVSDQFRSGKAPVYMEGHGLH